MECKRCNGRDFDVVIPSLLGSTYIECSNCHQGYIILDKLVLRYAEVIGNVTTNENDTIIFTCGKCKALRVVEADRGDLIKSTQLCNNCIEYTAKLSNTDANTVIKMAGDKISWDEFLNKAEKLA